MYVTPKSPKGWHKNAISLFVPVKFNFSRKKSATKFLCVKTFSGKVVATSFPYLTVHRSIAGDVPIYLKLAFKVTHPSENADFQSYRLSVLLVLALSGLVFHRAIPLIGHPLTSTVKFTEILPGEPLRRGIHTQGGSDI